jgi:hypothetical protein
MLSSRRVTNTVSARVLSPVESELKNDYRPEEGEQLKSEKSRESAEYEDVIF